MSELLLATGLTVAVVTDLRSRRIPNLLTAAMAAAGLGLAAAGSSGITLAGALMGMGLGVLLMLPGHLLGGTGAGDVKLMGAVGSILGPPSIIQAFVLTCLAGGVLAVGVAIARQRLAVTLEGTGRLLAGSGAPENPRQASAARRFAYGPAIAAGSVLAVLLR